MKKIIRVFLFFFILFFAPTFAFAGKKSGYAKIAELNGEVSMKRCGGDKKFQAVKGMKLVEGDTVYTGEKSSVSIILDNNSQVVIGENSAANLAEMRNLDSEKSSTAVQLKKGSIFSKVKKKLTGKEKFEIRTSNAVAGVRGTEFYVNVVGDSTYTYVLKGKVELSSYYSKKKVMAKKGQLAATDKRNSPYLIENDTKDLLDSIKKGFYGGYEEREYTYGNGVSTALSKEERQIGETKETEIHYASEEEQVIDQSNQRSVTAMRKPVKWEYNGQFLYRLKINGVSLEQVNSEGVIDYIDELRLEFEEILGPISGTASQSLIGKQAVIRVFSTGETRLFPIIVDSTGTHGHLIIPSSDMNFHSAESISIDLE